MKLLIALFFILSVFTAKIKGSDLCVINNGLNLAKSEIFHPIHISVTEIEYNAKTKSLEIAHKIFVDDFERNLNEIYGKSFQLGTKKELTDANTFIKEYIDKHFSFKVNKKPKDVSFLGKEVEPNSIWIYREIKNIKSLKNIVIKNTIMLDVFDDQKNIVHFKSPKLKKSFIFEEKYISDKILF